VAKEPRDVTQTIRFVTMNCVVIRLKSSLEALIPNAVELAETFTDETIERRVRTLLGTTLDNHVDQFDLDYPVSNAKDKSTTKLYLFTLL